MENIITFINNIIDMVTRFVADMYMHFTYGECVNSFGEGNLFEFANWANHVKTSMDWADNAIFVAAVIGLAICVIMMIWTIVNGDESVSKKEA